MSPYQSLATVLTQSAVYPVEKQGLHRDALRCVREEDPDPCVSPVLYNRTCMIACAVVKTSSNKEQGIISVQYKAPTHLISMTHLSVSHHVAE